MRNLVKEVQTDETMITDEILTRREKFKSIQIAQGKPALEACVGVILEMVGSLD